MLRRRLTLLIPLILVGVYACLRLPPGQDLLRLIVERQLSDVVGSNVDISRLRTNLWDEIRVDDVHWDSSPGPVHTLSVDSLRIRWTGGPPWSGRPAAINVHGLDLQLPAPAAQQAPASAIDDSANADEGGEDGDLRRWIPDLTSIEDLRIAVGDSSLVVAQLSGVLSAHRSVEDELPAAPTRIDFATDGATLRLPFGSRHWDTDIAGDRDLSSGGIFNLIFDLGAQGVFRHQRRQNQDDNHKNDDKCRQTDQKLFHEDPFIGLGVQYRLAGA